MIIIALWWYILFGVLRRLSVPFHHGKVKGQSLSPTLILLAHTRASKTHLASIQLLCRAAVTLRKRARQTGKKDNWKVQTTTQPNPSHTRQQTRIEWARTTNSHISPEPASNDTDWCSYIQVKEHGRRAPCRMYGDAACALHRVPDRGTLPAHAGNGEHALSRYSRFSQAPRHDDPRASY